MQARAPVADERERTVPLGLGPMQGTASGQVRPRARSAVGAASP